MQAKAERAAVLLHDADQPLVLAGPPRAMHGEFGVRNPTERKLVVRDLRLSPAAPPKGRVRAGIRALPVADPIALRRIVVRAGQSRPVPLHVSLDPRTPPGTYHAELDVGGAQRPVVMHVTEDIAFSLHPQEIVLEHRPGKAQTKRIVIANQGNVTLTLKPIGTVVIEEDHMHCRALRGALTDVGRTMKNLDDFLVALGSHYAALCEAHVLRVRNEAATIEPGETREIELTIVLPAKLDSGQRYTGSAPMFTDTLAFTVVPS